MCVCNCSTLIHLSHFHFKVGGIWLFMEGNGEKKDFFIKILDPLEVTFEQKTDSSIDRSDSVPGDALPINGWRKREGIDLLIACTQDDLKIYINGKLIKTWSDLHNPTQGIYPKFYEIIKHRKAQNSKATMFSWTYGKRTLIRLCIAVEQLL